METNPFITPITNRLDEMSAKLDKLSALIGTPPPKKISVPQYCQEEGCSRQTFYNRLARNEFTTERVGGRVYILRDSIKTR